MTRFNALPCIRQRLRQASWMTRILPGFTVIGLVALARALGLFQTAELRTLDTFLRRRPAEPKDERILIVGIDEADIQRLGTYPIPDQALADLLQALTEDSPRAIGIDIYRDLAIEPGQQALAEVLSTNSDIVGIEQIVGEPVNPPPSLPPEQVGFIDFPLDPDGFVRRTYLGTLPSLSAPEPDRFRFSFAFKLAKLYLDKEGVTIENGLHNPNNLRFGDTEFFQLQPRSGSYINASSAGLQSLIDPRSGETPFDIVSMREVMGGAIDESLVRDRVVLIGITSLTVKDLVNSAAVNSSNPGLVYGVEMHAHITSQILSTVLDNRPMLQVWSDVLEYLWIIVWGGIGIVLWSTIRRPAPYIVLAGFVAVGLVGFCFALLWLWGWWIPLVPALTAFAINGLVLVLPGFYVYDKTLRSRIDERQQVIERTYDAIHNGPLQTLATLRQQEDDFTPWASRKLEKLDQEIRTIYVRLLQESLPEEYQLQLGSQRVIDLRNPIKEVLYEVYTETLERDFPGFDTIRVCIPKFEPLRVAGISTDNRRALCRFLEEALCNVGKHAVHPKRLTVLCVLEGNENVIRVEDNGQPKAMVDSSGGRGSQQAHALAKRLRGEFRRWSDQSKTVCELRWPLS